MLLNSYMLLYIYWLIKEISSVIHNIVIFYFYIWKKILIVMLLSRTILSSNNNTKSLFTPWKLGSIKKYKYLFCVCFVVLDWYLFQLIVLLKPDSNCLNSFTLSWVESYNWNIKICISYFKFWLLIYCSTND